MILYSCILLGEVEKFLDGLLPKHRQKILDFLRLLEVKNGVLDEPYSRHLRGKIRELRVDFGRARYRILYAVIPEKKILTLIAFRKDTAKTPKNIIEKAEVMLRHYLQEIKKK